MKATVNKDLCIGCGLCAEICPEVFEMSDDMTARAIVDEVPANVIETAKDAASSCPVEAIAISE